MRALVAGSLPRTKAWTCTITGVETAVEAPLSGGAALRAVPRLAVRIPFAVSPRMSAKCCSRRLWC